MFVSEILLKLTGVLLPLLLFAQLRQVACDVTNNLQHFLEDITLKEDDLFLDVLRKIHAERVYYTIMVVKNAETLCPYEESISQMPIPKMLTHPRDTYTVLGHINSAVLAIACFDRRYDAVIADTLVANLEDVRQQRVIILGRQFRQPGHLLQQAMKMAENSQMTNVLVMFDTEETPKRVFYRLEPFPSYHIVQLLYDNEEGTQFFRQKWDLQGKAIIGLPDQNAPRSFAFRRPDGEIEISGYVGKLIKVFAEYSNATLQLLYPIEVGHQISHFDIVEFTINRTIDMSIALTGIYDPGDYLRMSYPLEVGFWMYMVPCAKEVATSEVYLIVMNISTWLVLGAILVVLSIVHSTIEYIHIAALRRIGRHLAFDRTNFLLNDQMMPGLLGQSFAERPNPLVSIKVTYLTIFLLGLVVNTLYSSHLKTLLTSHPKMPQVKTFDDVLRYNVKLAILPEEIKVMRLYVGADAYKRVKKQIEVQPSAEFFDNRNGLNASAGYTVTNSHWTVYEMQQRYYTRKVFCAVDGLVMRSILPMPIPLQRNSIYKWHFDGFILRALETGLLDIWRTQTYNEMLANDKISIEDVSEPFELDILRVYDLKWVWILLAIGWSLAVAMFSVELITDNWRKKRIRAL